MCYQLAVVVSNQLISLTSRESQMLMDVFVIVEGFQSINFPNEQGGKMALGIAATGAVFPIN